MNRSAMKTLRIPDEAHEKLTSLVGELTAQSGKMQKYADAIAQLLDSSIILPKDLLIEVSNVIEEGKVVGYTTREDFIRDAIRRRLDQIYGDFEYVIIRKEDYENLNKAIEETQAPYRNAEDYIREHINEMLAKYEAWKQKEGT